jgi:hypothetical protein
VQAEQGSADWKQVGPVLPAGVSIYQAAGGLKNTAYYISDGAKLWKSAAGANNSVEKWIQIVPQTVCRFFVNPYDANTIYIVADNGINRSDDGGLTWNADANLDKALTGNGEFTNKCAQQNCILNDLVVNPADPKQRFALGLAGIFFTRDGIEWKRLVDTVALPCKPVSAYYDDIADPAQHSLYVACYGRGILKIHPIPE